MTSQEAFEAWWESPTRPASLSPNSDFLAREAWLSACAWQVEACAKVAEDYQKSQQPPSGGLPIDYESNVLNFANYNGRISATKEIVDAIRATLDGTG